MLAQAVVAVLVAMAVIALILEPLARTEPQAAPADDAEDPEATPKGRALSALREIEFDRATGKLSEEDYAVLQARYGAQALSILKAEEEVSRQNGDSGDAGSAPAPIADPVEALVAEKVRVLRGGGAGPRPRTCPACGPRPEADAVFCSSCGSRLAPGGDCAGCGAPILPGARFCGTCGSPVAA